MIKAVVFDVDGVLLENKMFSERYSKKFKISYEILLKFFNGEFTDCLLGKSDLKKVLPKYISDWRWNSSVEKLMQYWLSEDIVNQDMTQLINQLSQKGIAAYLGSNQEKYRADYLRNILGFSKVFKKLFFSSKLGSKKPEKDFFLKIYRNIKDDLNIVKKHEILFIDDKIKNIKTLNKLGFKTHLYKDFKDFKAQIALMINK